MERALKRKYGVDVALAALPDTQEIQANRNIVERYTSQDSEGILKTGQESGHSGRDK